MIPNTFVGVVILTEAVADWINLKEQVVGRDDAIIHITTEE